jgi:hypothetical protein
VVGDTKLSDDVVGVGRLGTAAAWISAVCCLPYLFLKVIWTLDVPVGITDRSVLDDDGWVAANALMAVVQLIGLLLVLALTRPWSRRVPAWLFLFPVWVGTGLLFQLVVGVVLMGLFTPPSDGSGKDFGAFDPWVFVLVYASFAGQGIALAIAFACHVRSRWGRLLGQHTGDVVARRTARVGSWPEGHLAVMADGAAAMTAVVAGVFCYWAAGGSCGLSGAHAEDPWSLHASRAAGAVTAGVGLLGLAGHWGRRRRFWLPAALTWLGSGALVAFDGFLVMFTALPLLFGEIVAQWGWSVTDTFLVIKVLIGVLAAGVGTLAVTAAARDDQAPPVPVGTRADVLWRRAGDGNRPRSPQRPPVTWTRQSRPPRTPPWPWTLWTPQMKPRAAIDPAADK